MALESDSGLEKPYNSEWGLKKKAAVQQGRKAGFNRHKVLGESLVHFFCDVKWYFSNK